MIISMATANFYTIPFVNALDIIKQAGFQYIELDGYWRGGQWETAQHLKGIAPRDVLRMVRDSGLEITSFHDMGGVIEDGVDSVVSPATYEYLEQYDFPCIVLHTPCILNELAGRWPEQRVAIKTELQSIARGRLVCIENMQAFDGYYVPILSPGEMLEFSEEADISINIDTTHFAQCGVDIASAAVMLKDRVKTIHLSDYHAGRSHVFVGDGDLDLGSFYRQLNMRELYMTTIECHIPFLAEDVTLSIESCRRVKERVERLVLA